MPRKRKSNEPWRFMLGRKKEPEQAVESYLVKLEKLDSDRLSFWEDYCGFLAKEREKHLHELTDSLFQARIENQTYLKYSRIVSARYSKNPLSTEGSIICPPGRRFNFSKISSAIKSFHCLYVANNHTTAFSEKYLGNEEIAQGSLKPEELKFQKPGSYLHCRVNISLDNVLDLRDESSLDEFVKIISQISLPEDLTERAKKLGIGALKTVQDTSTLLRSILEENYSQWGTWISHPSNSQWIGHYARLAGINGIVYPSRKESLGHNIAIFPDTFAASDCRIELADQIEHISQEKRVMSKDNFIFFMNSEGSQTVH